MHVSSKKFTTYLPICLLLGLCLLASPAPAWPASEGELEKLVSQLRQSSNYLEITAVAQALVELKDPRAVAPLIQALGDEHDWVLTRAAEALVNLRAVDPLNQALGDENWRVRWAAAWALGKIKDPRAVAPLIQALGDEDWQVSQATAQVLVELQAVTPMRQALNDKGWRVRLTAAQALGCLGDPRGYRSSFKVCMTPRPKPEAWLSGASFTRKV
ncbi:MAG: HEAT repeat domain-containing protein [Deltaproteobacteria bacterium]|nr:HEAT repeat domain-containing protein [Deltaproteobacteria bacterium]